MSEVRNAYIAAVLASSPTIDLNGELARVAGEYWDKYSIDPPEGMVHRWGGNVAMFKAGMAFREARELEAINLMGKAILEREQAFTAIADCLEHLQEHLTCIDTQYQGSSKHEHLHSDLRQVIDAIQSLINKESETED